MLATAPALASSPKLSQVAACLTVGTCHETEIALFFPGFGFGWVCFQTSVAASLYPTSYDMPNGDGQASGGTYNYWDATYNGSGATTTDSAPLSGGLGVLTDGYVSPDPWYNVSNNSGTGPYVGWEWREHGDPTIAFNFAGSVVVGSVSLAVDNTHVGGVVAPIA